MFSPFACLCLFLVSMQPCLLTLICFWPGSKKIIFSHEASHFGREICRKMLVLMRTDATSIGDICILTCTLHVFCFVPLKCRISIYDWLLRLRNKEWLLLYILRVAYDSVINFYDSVIATASITFTLRILYTVVYQITTYNI